MCNDQACGGDQWEEHFVLGTLKTPFLKASFSAPSVYIMENNCNHHGYSCNLSAIWRSWERCDTSGRWPSKAIIPLLLKLLAGHKNWVQDGWGDGTPVCPPPPYSWLSTCVFLPQPPGLRLQACASYPASSFSNKRACGTDWCHKIHMGILLAKIPLTGLMWAVQSECWISKMLIFPSGSNLGFKTGFHWMFRKRK